MSEFEDQIRNGVTTEMGELPKDLGRREMDSYRKTADPSVPGNEGPTVDSSPFPLAKTIPPDAITNTAALKRPYGIGILPSHPVISSYDTLPVHGRDFLKEAWSGWVDQNPNPGIDATLTYTVPEGYIGILRGFRYSPLFLVGYSLTDISNNVSSPPTDLSDNLFFRVSIEINNTPVPGFYNLAMDQYCNDKKCQIIADSGDIITLRLRLNNNLWFTLTDDPLGAGGDGSPVHIQLYGHELIKRGLSLPYEISSQD